MKRRYHVIKYALWVTIGVFSLANLSFANGNGKNPQIDLEGTVSILCTDHFSEDAHFSRAEMKYTLHVSKNEKYVLRSLEHEQLQLRAGQKIKVKGVKLGKNRKGEEELVVIMYAPGSGKGGGSGGDDGIYNNNAYMFDSIPSSLNVAFVLIESLDSPCHNASVAEAEQMIYYGAENLRDLWLEDSNGKLELIIDADNDGYADVFGPYTAPYVSSDPASPQYSANYDSYVNFAQQQMVSDGVDMSAFDKVVWILPRNQWGLSWGGKAQYSGRFVWANHGSLFVKHHELNHTIGLTHAANDPEDDGQYNAVYADTSCVQGIAYRNIGLNIPMAYEMGYLNTKKRDAEIIELPSRRGLYNYRLYAKGYDQTSLKAIYFERSQSNTQLQLTRYVLSCRSASGYDANLADQYLQGLHIHRHLGAGYLSMIIKTLQTGESHDFLWAPVTVKQVARAADGSYTDIEVQVW